MTTLFDGILLRRAHDPVTGCDPISTEHPLTALCRPFQHECATPVSAWAKQLARGFAVRNPPHVYTHIALTGSGHGAVSKAQGELRGCNLPIWYRKTAVSGQRPVRSDAIYGQPGGPFPLEKIGLALFPGLLPNECREQNAMVRRLIALCRRSRLHRLVTCTLFFCVLPGSLGTAWMLLSGFLKLLFERFFRHGMSPSDRYDVGGRLSALQQSCPALRNDGGSDSGLNRWTTGLRHQSKARQAQSSARS